MTLVTLDSILAYCISERCVLYRAGGGQFSTNIISLGFYYETAFKKLDLFTENFINLLTKKMTFQYLITGK